MAPIDKGKDKKRPKKALAISVKLEIVKRLEKGESVASIMSEFNLPKTTVYDTKKNKETIKLFANNITTDTKHKKKRMTMKKGKYPSVEEAVVKWFKQQRSVNVMVRSTEMLDAAERFARLQGIDNFKASVGWLARVKQRHSITSRRAYGEKADADTTSIEDFKKELAGTIERHNLSNLQIYNADETGLYWRSVPTRTLAEKKEQKIKGHKVNKNRVSIMCCANASGSHRCRPVVVGRYAKPHPLRKHLNNLPVIYKHSQKSWFTTGLFTDWFKNHFVPEVVRYQTEELKIARDDVKALLVLDNAPAHPSVEDLWAISDKVRVMYLPVNCTSIVQPMDQGVIASVKRFYRRRFLRETMAVLEEEGDEEEDTRGARTLANLKSYTLFNCVHNWARAWNDIPPKTLENAWNPLLKGADLTADFEGFEENVVTEFHAQLTHAGERHVTVEDVRAWLGEDSGDPGSQLQSEQEIAESSPGFVVSAAGADGTAAGSDAEEPDPADAEPILKLSAVRTAVDSLLGFLDHNECPTAMFRPQLYDELRLMRETVIQSQNQRTYHQSKLERFFALSPPPAPPTSTPVPVTPQPRSSPLRRRLHRIASDTTVVLDDLEDFDDPTSSPQAHCSGYVPPSRCRSRGQSDTSATTLLSPGEVSLPSLPQSPSSSSSSSPEPTPRPFRSMRRLVYSEDESD